MRNHIEGFTDQPIGYGGSGSWEVSDNEVWLTGEPYTAGLYAISVNSVGGGTVGKGLLLRNVVIDKTTTGSAWGGINAGTSANLLMKDNITRDIRGAYSFQMNSASSWAVGNISLGGAANNFAGAGLASYNLDP
jgi:hypothetical protein